MRCEFTNLAYSGPTNHVESFTVTYVGLIQSGSKTGKAREKHELRKHFSDQIWNKWTQVRILKQYLRSFPPADFSPGDFCEPSDRANPFFYKIFHWPY
jgi:hypothetical protein